MNSKPIKLTMTLFSLTVLSALAQAAGPVVPSVASPGATSSVGQADANQGYVHSSRLSSEIHAIKNSSSLGILFGWRYVALESDRFAVGGAGYTGQFGGTNSGVFSYGGLVVSHMGKLSSSIASEITLLAGGGGGSAGAVSGAGIILEPGLSLGFVLGPKVRSVLNGGYVWMPSASTLGGPSFGIRFEFALN